MHIDIFNTYILALSNFMNNIEDEYTSKKRDRERENLRYMKHIL